MVGRTRLEYAILGWVARRLGISEPYARFVEKLDNMPAQGEQLPDKPDFLLQENFTKPNPKKIDQ